MRKTLTWIACLLIGLAACTEDNALLDRTTDLKAQQWFTADSLSFDFEVSDTVHPFTIYVNVRHSAQYEWQNLWVQLSTLQPDGTETNQRVELPLSEPDGRWYGDCRGDICFHRVTVQPAAFFPMAGTYTLRLSQLMRENPVEHLLGMGIRIEQCVSEECKGIKRIRQ